MNCARRPAGARKPAPSTPAGSPSRPDLRAGQSRARLFHLPVLALLLAALNLFPAAPAQAQTPAAPTALNIIPGDASLRLSWTAPSGTLTGYDVHYTSAPASGNGSVANTAAASGNNPAAAWVAVSRTGITASQTISSLVNGRAYRVRVRATNASGDGAWVFGAKTPAIPYMEFELDTLLVVESDTEPEDFVVLLSAPLTVQTTVEIRVRGFGGASTADFTLSETSLTFAAGDTEKSFGVTAVADMLTEGNETVTLELVPPASAPYTLGSNDHIQFVIIDDSFAPGVPGQTSLTQVTSGDNAPTATTLSFTVECAQANDGVPLTDYQVYAEARDNRSLQRTYYFPESQCGSNGPVTLTGLPLSSTPTFWRVRVRARALRGESGSWSQWVTDAATLASTAEDTTALTATFANVPAAHQGVTFSFLVNFSVTPDGGQPPTKRSFETSHGAVWSVERVSAKQWRVRIRPQSWRQVGVALRGGLSCNDPDAVCASGVRALSNSPSATIGAAARIRANNFLVQEAEDAKAKFRVWLTRALTHVVRVDYETKELAESLGGNSPATAGSDYTATSGTLVFTAGQTSKVIQVPIIDDSIEDSNELFRLVLSNPRGAVLDGSEKLGLIQNHETQEEFTITILDRDDNGGGAPTDNGDGGDNGNNGDGTPTDDNDNGGAPANNNNGGGTSTPTNNNGGAPTNTGGGSAGGGGGGSAPAPSSRAALSDLVVTPRDEDGNPGKRLALSPAFAPSTTAYTLDVPYTTGTLDIMPGLTSGTAAVGTRGAGAFPAAQSYPVSLPPGETTVIEITVTAEDGSRTRAYTLRATRAAPNTDPSLPALVVRGNDDADVNLSPAFSPDNTDYEASLAYAVDAVTLTPATRDTGARVRIGGREVPGGQASAPVPLAVGSNEITLTVTAEDGLATRAYTLTLARAGADAEPPAADPRALPDLSRALADDTQHSIATRLATARTPAPGRTAPLSARLTQALAAVLPGQAAGAAAPAPAFDPVLAEARVDSGWAAPAAPVNWQALLDNAGAALALGAAPDAGESPTGLASLSLWSDGAYRRVGGHNDGLDWSGDLMGARIGLDMRLTPSLTGGAALGWQRAGWTGNAGGAGATRHTLSLLGLNPYAGWQRGRLSAWVSGGLGKGTLNSRQRGDERSADGYSANDHSANGYSANGYGADGYSGDGPPPATRGGMLEARPQLPGNHGADGYSEDGYHGDTHSEDVATHTLGGGLAGRLFDTDALSLGLKAEALATSLATGTHRARTHRLRLALDATHVRRLSNDAVLTPALELGLRHDGGAGPGGLGLEAGGALRYAGGPLTLRGQARALVGRGGYREWGLSGTAEWRARTDGRGLMLRLAPGLGSAQSGIGQLWAQGLRDKTHGAPQQAARLDASLSYAWDAPGHRGRITPYLELRRQQAAAAYRLGARWDAPSGFSLRLAGERNAGYAGAPADHALLLEGSWRPGR